MEPTRIAFADAVDDRIAEAVSELHGSGDVHPVVVEPSSDLELPIDVETVSVKDPAWRDKAEALYAANLTSRGKPTDTVGTDVDDPVLFAALLCSLGHADAGVAGSVSTSASVIRAGIFGLGTAVEGGLVTGTFMLEIGDRTLTVADASVVPAPTADQLAQIAVLAADAHSGATGEEARVAMLSFSTNGSARHPDVDKVREATAQAQAARPDLAIDGEMQFDVAVAPEVAARKFPDSAVAGRANVLIFPDLGAANITYKAIERLAGARATGSFVLGLAKPFVDLSRGCAAPDIVDAARALAAMHRQAAPA